MGRRKVIRAPFFPTFHSPLINIYRSEQTASLQTIDNALLWGSANDNHSGGVGYSGISSDVKTEMINYFNQIQFEAKDNLNIDTSIGYAGNCSYWLALALAIDSVFIKKDKQFIMVGKIQFTASVVSYLQK
ncbi:hypothetical protein A9G22_06050 [Gilliamella sp. App2-1]|uniref:hypothetical protein n=1 Tax=Gilliamella sp. App2-1 TaxID=3120230 RepID=UPI000827E98E|nr:hypothetical protein [Gilliamella apicola]OCG23604.1 hypothetical protein A9G22_06050 [Gilliamella apicola]